MDHPSAAQRLLSSLLRAAGRLLPEPLPIQRYYVPYLDAAPPRCGAGAETARSWDEHWTERLLGPASSTQGDRCNIAGRLRIRSLVERLANRGARRLLFMGNGISLLPWAFAHAGYESVVLDVSSVATEYLRKHTILEADLRYFYYLREFDGMPGFDECRREGGHVELVCGNVLDAAVAQGPFDAVFSERSLQGFPPDVLPAAVRAIDARLAETAECHVLIQNSAEAYDRIIARFTELGYQHVPLGEEPAAASKRRLYIMVASG